MQTINRSAPIMVTGGTGFIAGWIIKFLLEEGLSVHATVRDPGNQEKVAHLEAMAGSSPGQLHMFKADLLEPGSFDEAMAGCELVMHTASPFVISTPKDPQAEFIRPALNGTQNVLASVGWKAIQLSLPRS